MAQPFDIWKLLSQQSDQVDQTNPLVMQQLASQAGQEPPQMPEQPPMPPQIMPAPAQRVQLSAQPTVQPLGTLPQEIVPQPEQSLMGPPPELMRQIQASDIAAKKALAQQTLDVEALRNNLAEYQQRERGTDYRPLAALVDSMFGGGGNFAKAAQAVAPESEAERQKNIGEQLNKIATHAGYLSKDQIDRLKSQLSAYGSMGAAGLRSATQGARVGVAQDRLAAQAADLFDKDQIIKRNETQKQQIDLDRHTLETAKILTPQIFDEIQIGLANAISGGRTAAVSTQNKVEFDSVQKQLVKLQQRVSNKPQDINSPEVRRMLIDTMNRLSEAYQNNSYARAKQLRHGRDKVYKNNPNAIAVMNEKVESYKPGSMPMPSDNLEQMSDEELLKLYQGGQ